MGKRITDDEKNSIKKDYQNGMTVNELCDKYNRHRKSVRDLLSLRQYTDRHIYTIEEVKEMIKPYGYTMIEDSFTNLNKGFDALTGEGYRVVITKNLIYKKQKPFVFNSLNPYTIDNIRHYIELNDIPTKLISTEYINAYSMMQFRCGCGCEFETTWNRFFGGQKLCRLCAVRRNASFNMEEISQEFSDRGYTLVTQSKIFTKNDKLEYICNEHGHKFISYAKFLKGQGCIECARKNNGIKKRIPESELIKITKKQGFKYINCKMVGVHSCIDFICPIHEDKGVQTKSITQMKQCEGRCFYCSLTYSKGEEEISKLLDKHGIKYFRQYRFDDCRDKNPLPFDFYLMDLNVCIEFDGEQHFEPIDFSGNDKNVSKENLKLIQNHDKIKTEYCKTNDILLIRVPHWERENIECFLFEQFKNNKIPI